MELTQKVKQKRGKMNQELQEIRASLSTLHTDAESSDKTMIDLFKIGSEASFKVCIPRVLVYKIQAAQLVQLVMHPKKRT